MTNELDKLRGGVAVITGAGSGIGEAMARKTAALGMKVVLADIASERIERLAAALQEDGATVLAVPTDVSDPASIDALADKSFAAYGEVSLLMNNAGVETLGFTWEIPADTWDKSLAINIDGVVHGVRAFVPRIIESGKPAFIANTSSVGGLSIMPVQTAYIMSKHAVLAFSECLRMEMQVKQLPIEVSVITPGPVTTRIFTDSNANEDPISAQHRAIMEGMLAENGMSAEEAAEVILPQIASGKFWVSTHPDMTRDYAAARAAQLAQLGEPVVSPELMAMLGETGAG